MKKLQSLYDIYNKKLFRNPYCQRGYAWGIRQLSDFWDDLIALYGNRFHYTGVLSIKEVHESVWKNLKKVISVPIWIIGIEITINNE